VLQGFHAFFVVFFLFRMLPFVGFLEGGELKKNLQVGSIYLRAKKKRVNLRPVLLSFFSPRQQAQIRPELLDKQREKTPAAPPPMGSSSPSQPTGCGLGLKTKAA